MKHVRKSKKTTPVDGTFCLRGVLLSLVDRTEKGEDENLHRGDLHGWKVGQVFIKGPLRLSRAEHHDERH